MSKRPACQAVAPHGQSLCPKVIHRPTACQPARPHRPRRLWGHQVAGVRHWDGRVDDVVHVGRAPNRSQLPVHAPDRRQGGGVPRSPERSSPRGALTLGPASGPHKRRAAALKDQQQPGTAPFNAVLLIILGQRIFRGMLSTANVWYSGKVELAVAEERRQPPADGLLIHGIRTAETRDEVLGIRGRYHLIAYDGPRRAARADQLRHARLADSLEAVITARPRAAGPPRRPRAGVRSKAGSSSRSSVSQQAGLAHRPAAAGPGPCKRHTCAGLHAGAARALPRQRRRS